MVMCDDLMKLLVVITVTAISNKWQQALGFVSCAQVFPGVKQLENTESLQNLRLGKGGEKSLCGPT